MKITLLSLLVSASAYAAAPAVTTNPTTGVAPGVVQPTNGKIQFEIFTPNDSQVHIGQPLQLLNLETARPDLYAVNVRYFADKKEKWVPTATFWKTAYVAKYHREKLAQWLQCVYFDSETHTCAPLLGIDLKPMAKREKELRNELAANYEAAKTAKATRGEVFINGMRYQGPLAYGQLLNDVNPLLPKEKQLAQLGKYEVTKVWIIGNETGFGKRDLALEREFYRWIPNLTFEVLSPTDKKAVQILKDAEVGAIPAYIFDKAHQRNVAVQKMAIAGRVQINKVGYGKFDMKGGTTEFKTALAPQPNTLDLWVMSQCPYGVKAENAYISAVAQKLVKDGVKVNLRYIASEVKGEKGKTEWKALHGEPELTENIRQLAIQKMWPDKFWKYLEIRNTDYNSEDWKPAATAAGLDPAEVEKQMPLGRKLMAQDIKDGALLKVSGSPTYLWENRYVLGTSEDMQAVLGYNPHEVKPLETKKLDQRTPTNAPAPAPKAAANENAKCG